MDEDRDEERVWCALSVIRELAEENEAPKGLVAGEAELRRLLMQPRFDTPAEMPTVHGRFTALLHHLSGRTPSTEACIDWLKKTGKFSEPELNLIRRVKLFYENATGHVLLRQRRLSDAHAVFLLSLLTFSAGVWVGWVLFSSNAGLQQIANSLAFGIILGTLARIVLDWSFRSARVREKVLGVAPWLQEQGMPT